MKFLIGAELYQIIQGQYKTAIRKNTVLARLAHVF
jgi:hypothetical protein